MDNGNVAEVTSLQSAMYLKFRRLPEKVHALACISLDYLLSPVWLKLNENWEQ